MGRKLRFWQKRTTETIAMDWTAMEIIRRKVIIYTEQNKNITHFRERLCRIGGI